MTAIKPIKDKTVLKKVLTGLHEENERDQLLFLTCIYSAMKITEILNLKVKDITDNDMKIYKGTSSSFKRVSMNKELKQVMQSFIKDKKPYEYIFKSREGYNEPIRRQTAHKILRQIGEKHNLTDVGPETLRKTFGYHFYKQSEDIGTLSKIYGHKSENETLQYIGMLNRDIKSAYLNFDF